MRTIRTIHDGTVAERTLVRLQRMERTDDTRACHHGWSGDRWSWGHNRVWIAEYYSNHALSWGYVYTFHDGTLGVSTVREMNEALAALGHRVDPEVEATTVVDRPNVRSVLGDLLAERPRPRPTNSWVNWTPGTTWTIDDDWSIRCTEGDEF